MTKYKNIKITVNSIKFASKGEEGFNGNSYGMR